MKKTLIEKVLEVIIFVAVVWFIVEDIPKLLGFTWGGVLG